MQSLVFGVLTFVISTLILIQGEDPVNNRIHVSLWFVKDSRSRHLTIKIAFLNTTEQTQRFQDKFDYFKARDGYVEGYTLCFTVIWWLCGVGYM